MAYTTETTHTQTTTGNRDFLVGFPFLATTDIKVQLNGTTKSLTSDYTIVQSGANTTINFNTAPADNDTIRIFRDTDIDAIKSTYSGGSAIRSTDLNSNNTQLLYAAQEFGTLKEDNSVSFTLGNKGDINVNSSSDWVINNNAIDLAHMTHSSVGTNELVDDCVTEDKLANNAVVTVAIQNNSITNDKMADNSVNTTDIVNNAVTRDKVTPGGFNPVGTVIWFAGSSAPAGYLKSNGNTIPNGSGTVQGITADFSALYAVIGSALPDLRGEFIRGLDDGRNVDNSRAIRSTQAEENKQHTHTATTSTTTTLNASITNISETFEADGSVSGIFSKESGYSAGYTPSNVDSSNTGKLILNANHNHTTTIANEGGENRPRNVALLACIKY